MSDGATEPAANATEPAATALPARRAVDPGTSDDARFALILALFLSALGAVLGLAWAVWSPAGPRALVLAPGVLQPDETEAFVAGDGRFLVLGAVVGIGAGVFAWLRARHRGVAVLLGLAVGGVAGSLLMELTGHLSGGGTFAGRTNTIIEQLPLSLHASGLLVIEPAVAVLLYGVLAAFAVRDDLGRPDPVREAIHPNVTEDAPAVSVGAGDHPQYGGRDGDAAGVLQQRDLPPQ